MLSAGAEIVPTGSWKEAPKEHIIVGLKELPEEKCISYSISLHYQFMMFVGFMPSNAWKGKCQETYTCRRMS